MSSEPKEVVTTETVEENVPEQETRVEGGDTKEGASVENGDVTPEDASEPDVSKSNGSDDAEKDEEKTDGPTVTEDEVQNGGGAETETSKETEENGKDTEASKDTEDADKGTDDPKEVADKVTEAPKEAEKTEPSKEAEDKETEIAKESEQKDKPDEEVETETKEDASEGTKDDAKESDKEEEAGDDGNGDDAEMQDAKEEENESEETKTPRKRKKYAETLVKESAHILPVSATKRSRKSVSASSYQPENFKGSGVHAADPNLDIPKGRGTALKDISAVRNKITSCKQGDPILKEAHKVLYGGPGGITGKGKVKVSLIKGNILEFTGFLPFVEDNEDATEEEKEEITENEERIHERYRTIVEKLQLPLIKSLCDIFQVKRGSAPLKKKELIKVLLTFLASPGSEMVIAEGEKKRRGRKPGSKNKKKAVSVEKDEDEDEDMDEDENETEGGTPSAAQLKKWVKAYINCFNLDKATAKHAIETASDKFGTDMSDKKSEIMDLLREAMS